MGTKKKTQSLKDEYTFYSVHEAYENVSDGTSHLEDFETLEEAIECVNDKLNDEEEGRYVIYKNVPVSIHEKTISKKVIKL